MIKNEKGFTLVELLAVIVILGLLMAIAIPSVTKYITQSRKKTLISTMDSYVTAATTAVNDNEFGAMSKEDTMYYIPVSNDEANSCVSLEKGGTDPFGNWKEAYVVVNYDSDNYSYDYYFTFYDDAGYGMELTKIEDISASGNIITNPSPVNADNITTQTNDRASNVKVLQSGSCNVSTAVSGSQDVQKVTTLAGTTWKFNEQLGDYSMFDKFDYINQTGWTTLPNGSIMYNNEVNINLHGLTQTNIIGTYAFSSVQSMGENNFLYAPQNDNIASGWYYTTPEDNYQFFYGNLSDEEIIVMMKSKTITQAPIIYFGNEKSEYLESKWLIDWFYENAVMQ